jgi:hypothetical protein
MAPLDYGTYGIRRADGRQCRGQHEKFSAWATPNRCELITNRGMSRTQPTCDSAKASTRTFLTPGAPARNLWKQRLAMPGDADIEVAIQPLIFFDCWWALSPLTLPRLNLLARHATFRMRKFELTGRCRLNVASPRRCCTSGSSTSAPRTNAI